MLHSHEKDGVQRKHVVVSLKRMRGREVDVANGWNHPELRTACVNGGKHWVVRKLTCHVP